MLTASQVKSYTREVRGVQQALEDFKLHSDQLSKRCTPGASLWVVTAAHEFVTGELRIYHQSTTAAHVNGQTDVPHGVELQIEGSGTANSYLRMLANEAVANKRRPGRWLLKMFGMAPPRSYRPLALQVQLLPVSVARQQKRSGWCSCFARGRQKA